MTHVDGIAVLSGYLLEIYCPETGPRNSKMMWGIIALVTATSPVLITLTQKWVREPPRGKEKDGMAGKGTSDDGDSEGGEGHELESINEACNSGGGKSGGSTQPGAMSERHIEHIRILSEMGLNSGETGGMPSRA